MIRIIICDDHGIVRRGLHELLVAENDMRVVGEAADSAALVELLGQRTCDLLVLDVSLPGRSGLDVLQHVKSKQKNLRVLMLTMHPEEQFATRALRAGAAGYLTKDCSSEELLRAIRRIAAGGTYVSDSLAERLAGELHDDADQAPHERLSDREFEVLHAIASGKTVGEIAASLFLSPNTVSTYRTRLLQKLRLRNNAELMLYAVNKQLMQ